MGRLVKRTEVVKVGEDAYMLEIEFVNGKKEVVINASSYLTYDEAVRLQRNWMKK